MINFINRKTARVMDLRAERLYREAEDDLFYFSKVKAAQKKVDEALGFCPDCVKFLTMRAGIAIVTGKIEEALEFYKRAQKVNPYSVSVLSGVANVYDLLGEYEKALDYVEKAFSLGKIESSEVAKSLLNLKISVLVKLKRYTEAKSVVDLARYSLNCGDLQELQAENLFLIKQKIKLHNKINKMDLRLVK